VLAYPAVEALTKVSAYTRSLYFRKAQVSNVKNSQYPTKRIMTQRINPSIPLPFIVRHACTTAMIAAAAACSLHEDRRFLRWVSFLGSSFMASNFLPEDSTTKVRQLQGDTGKLTLHGKGEPVRRERQVGIRWLYRADPCLPIVKQPLASVPGAVGWNDLVSLL